MRREAKKKVKTVADLIGRAEFHVIPSFMADSIKRNTTKSTGILTAIEEHTQTQVQCPLPLPLPFQAIDLHLRAVKMPTAMPS